MSLELFLTICVIITLLGYVISKQNKETKLQEPHEYCILTIFRNGQYETIPLEGTTSYIVSFLMIEAELGRTVHIIHKEVVDAETFQKFADKYFKN